jgi:hypothetical protein
MKNLMTKQNLIILGVGLVSAIVVYKVLVNRAKKDKVTNETGKPVLKPLAIKEGSSDFCGCGA